MPECEPHGVEDCEECYVGAAFEKSPRWTTAKERHAYFVAVRWLVEGPPRRSHRDVGDELGLSTERVRQIVKEAEAVEAARISHERGRRWRSVT